MPGERPVRGSSIRIPYPRGAIAGSGSKAGCAGPWVPLRREDGLAVARDAVRQPRGGLHTKHSLRLGRKRDRSLEGVGNAMGA